VHWAPGIPRALFDEGDEIFRQTSGVMRGEIATPCSSLRGALATKQSSFFDLRAMLRWRSQ
jgi:hypothetical protein